ncbi:hypothetical protein [Phaffia rhodozyma]|uniref:Uncharacterized protein n=1 Tax=Phaffia rhodozyma TaxID=264483 RepID=A0A0F7SRF7_PHARH|nr:hypothetical protein [Phaffia rhodozyma]
MLRKTPTSENVPKGSGKSGPGLIVLVFFRFFFFSLDVIVITLAAQVQDRSNPWINQQRQRSGEKLTTALRGEARGARRRKKLVRLIPIMQDGQDIFLPCAWCILFALPPARKHHLPPTPLLSDGADKWGRGRACGVNVCTFLV